MKRTVISLMGGLFAFLSLQAIGYAQSIAFSAHLNTAQAMPAPMVTTNPTGTGVALLTRTEEGETRLAFEITVTDLSGPILIAHFHRADAGVSGGVVRDLTGNFVGNTAKGVWSSADANQPLTPELVETLVNGGIYINVHTDANRSGEIRGQVYPTLSFRASLDAAQEIPAPNVSGTPTGTAALTLRGISNGGVELAFELTVDALTGPVRAAHFHLGAPGDTGGVVRTITTEFNGNTAAGVWRSTVQTQPLSPQLLKALIAGNLYLNVHTEMNPAGEIRGQVVQD